MIKLSTRYSSRTAADLKELDQQFKGWMKILAGDLGVRSLRRSSDVMMVGEDPYGIRIIEDYHNLPKGSTITVEMMDVSENTATLSMKATFKESWVKQVVKHNTGGESITISGPVELDDPSKAHTLVKRFVESIGVVEVAELSRRLFNESYAESASELRVALGNSLKRSRLIDSPSDIVLSPDSYTATVESAVPYGVGGLLIKGVLSRVYSRYERAKKPAPRMVSLMRASLMRLDEVVDETLGSFTTSDGVFASTYLRSATWKGDDVQVNFMLTYADDGKVIPPQLRSYIASSNMQIRLAARSDSLFLGLSDMAFARILTEAAYSYVLRTGEAHPDAPKASSIQRAISDYDGSTESEDRIDNAYFTFFVDNPPPPKFLSYAAEQLKEGAIGRDVFRRDRTTLPTQLIKVKNLIPEELADAAMQYVFRTGEGHPDAPDTTDIRKALSANDGSDGAVHAIREAYHAAFTRTPPSEAFLRYAEGLVRSNEIVRRKGKPSRFAHAVAARWLAASDGQDSSRWPSYLRLMPPLPPEEEPVAGYDGMVQLLRRLEAGDEVEITYRDSHTGYEATSRRTVSTSWQELKDQHSDTFKRPTVLLQAKVKGRFKEGMVSDYGGSVQWQPTPSTPVARVILIRKV